jgi:hypothetical protein
VSSKNKSINLVCPKLLLPHFKFGDGDTFEMQALLSVDLKAKYECVEGPHEILNDTIVEQGGFIGSTHWTLAQSIVPIVETSRDKKSVKCLGTGFYVHSNGILLTAAHVLADYFERAKERDYIDVEELISQEGQSPVGILLQRNRLYGDSIFEFLPIIWSELFAQRHESPLPWEKIRTTYITDIAICQTFVSQTTRFQPLAIIQPGISGFGAFEGKDIFAVGYSGMEDFSMQKDSANNMMKFRPHFTKGKVLKRIPNNHIEKTVPSPGPCFQMNAPLSAGMSGSPVFDSEGIYVHGVSSSSWQGNDGSLQSESYCSMIAPVCDVPLAGLKGRSIFDLLKNPKSQMIKIHGPGDI